MIRGKYVAEIKINFEFDENNPDLLPFDALKDVFDNKLSGCIKEIIESELDGIAAIEIEQKEASLEKRNKPQ